MSFIPDVSQITSALEIAALAVCTARVARTSQYVNDALVHESLRLYAQGLHVTRRALEDRRLLRHDEILGACVLLGAYEIFECPSNARSGYLSHYEGCAELIQLRGPDAHKQGIGHSIFLAFRTMGAFESLLHKKTFLSDDAWKTVPFSVIPKSPYDRLLDIVLEAPAIMTVADEMSAIKSPYRKFEEALRIADLCWGFDRTMGEFLDNLKASANGPLHWPVFPNSPTEKIQNLEEPDELANLFPVEYQFIDFKVANTLVVYWGITLILYHGMGELYGLLEQLRPHAEAEAGSHPSHEEKWKSMIKQERELPPLEHRKDLLALVRHICQSVEYCTRDELTLSTAMAPLNMIVNVLVQCQDYERELEWTGQAMERLRQRGVEMVKYLPVVN